MNTEDNLKRRLMSRMKNYTNNQRILKRYKNDLNLLGNVTKSETLKEWLDWLIQTEVYTFGKDEEIIYKVKELTQKLKELETK